MSVLQTSPTHVTAQMVREVCRGKSADEVLRPNGSFVVGYGDTTTKAIRSRQGILVRSSGLAADSNWPSCRV